MKTYLIIFFLFFLGVSNAQEIIRVPYLQKPTHNSIVIRWRTNTPVIGKVTWYESKSETFFMLIDSIAVTDHVIELKGLKPNTKYSYKVGTVAAVQLEGPNYSFTTFPTPGVSKPFRIWAMGDFGDLTKQGYVDNQKAVYSAFNKFNNSDLDLWMWLGDNAYCCGLDSQYQSGVFDFYRPELFSKTPIVSVPGNHEYYGEAGSEITRKIPYFDIISVPTNGEGGGVTSGNKAYYSFDMGNIHFVALDSYGLDFGKKLYDLESVQYKWMIKDLTENYLKKTSKWTVVFFHHPPYTKLTHDSDSQNDLATLRRVLVPIFDYYKVDLVLSGHSHVYERSYLIKNQIESSNTFDFNNEVVQKTKALYTKDSSPIINKDDGTMFVVTGSSGRLDWNGKNEVHPVFAYSNKDFGGSLLLNIEDNRLDGNWICADGTIKDNFTMFKNVNINDTINLKYGDEVTLSASWPGNYRWSSGQINQRKIKGSYFKNTTVTVSDSLGYLKDSFVIKVDKKPEIFTEISNTVKACSGNRISGSFEVQNEDIKKWTYQLELSDKNGNFSSFTNLGTSKDGTFDLQIPASIPVGESYKVRVHCINNSYFNEFASKSFSINLPVSAQIVPEERVVGSTNTVFKVEVIGTLPATIKLNNSQEVQLNKAFTEFSFTPSQTTTYFLEYVKNVCGDGRIFGSKLIVEVPLANELFKLSEAKVYPNPFMDEITIESSATLENPIKAEVYNSLGKLIKTFILDHKSKTFKLRTNQSVNYILKLTKGTEKASFKLINNN